MRLVETHDNTEVYECTVRGCGHSAYINLEDGIPHPSDIGDLTAYHVIVKKDGLTELKPNTLNFDVDAE